MEHPPYEHVEKHDYAKKEIDDSFHCLSKEEGNEQSTVDEDNISMADDQHSVVDDVKSSLDPWPFRAGPAIHVISVLIYTPDTGPSDSHVYGEITITDYLKRKFYIYNCGEEDPELLGHEWYYIGLTRCPIAPVMGGNVRFELTSKPIDNSSGAVLIFDKEYDMNEARKDDDGCFVLVCEGNLGYRFEMVFTKIPFAVIAKVLEMFVKSPAPCPGEEEFYTLHGKIIVNNVHCFEIEPEEAVKAKRGKECDIPLYRNVYAVPVDSALALDLELYNSSIPITKKRYTFDACQETIVPAPPTHLVDCEADGYAFGIEVQWMFQENFFAFDAQIMSSPTFPPLCKICGPFVSGALVEVFSVVFCGGNSSTPCDIDLHGTIVVSDGVGEFNILAGNKDCPDKLLVSKTDEHQFRTLSLEWPNDRWVVGDDFNVNLNLKDAANNPVCKAQISWWAGDDSRYDYRLCDILKGDKGYLAAVHYSVFKNGKKAKVSVECSNGTYSIYGNVFAKYKDQDYFSTYDEQCFQSILFKRSMEDPMVVTGQIHLLKSQVSAPSDCNELIVRGDLWVRPSSETCPHKLFHFDTTDGKSCNIGWEGILTVKVEWV